MTTDENKIRLLVAAWVERTRAGDVAAVLAMMAEDVVFLTAGRPPMIGRAAFAEASRAQTPPNAAAPHIDAEQEIEEITVVGDVAWMRTTLRIVITPTDGSPPITRAGHTLSVLRKIDGRWIIARDANLLTKV